MYDWNLYDPFLNTWVLMAQAFEASYRATEVEIGRQGVTLAQFNILMLLDRSEVPLTPGQIASYVFREKHSVSAQLTRMQRAGYVRKTRSRDDQRVIEVRITARGKAVLEPAKRAGLGHAHRLVALCFSEEETRRLCDQLKTLRDCALQELGDEVRPLPDIFGVPGLPSRLHEEVLPV